MEYTKSQGNMLTFISIHNVTVYYTFPALQTETESNSLSFFPKQVHIFMEQVGRYPFHVYM